LLKGSAIDIFEWFDVIYNDALINLVASGIEWPKLYNFFADFGNEATITGTTSSR
jgi:hypothetical protein